MAATGFTPISLYYSSTTTNVPTAGNLVAGELALNTADGKLFYKDSSNVVQVIGTKGGVGTSSTTQVLYNSSGLVVGSANMVFDGTALTVGGYISTTGTAATNATSLRLTGTTTGYNRAQFANSAGGYYIGANGSAASGWITGTGAYSLVISAPTQPIHFSASTATDVTIDSSGNLLVGKTTAGALNTGVQFYPAGTSTAVTSSDTSSTGPLFYLVNAGATVQNGYRFISFRNTSSFTEIGTVTNNSGTGVLYNITSDYRLKNVISPVTNSGERLDLLEPIEYEWKSTGNITKGFLAHKFAEVYPNSVSGEKDAVDEDGKPTYQGMQPSSAEVMADLIAEIQSLRKRLTALEAK